MEQSIGLVALVVREYDEAIAFYVGVLGFTLLEDSYVPEQDKRWVVVAPPGGQESRLLLARAVGDEQSSRIGNQTGGRVFLFLTTDDFWRDFRRYTAAGVVFVREPRDESYGTVAVFRDLYGNLWDLVQRNRRPLAQLREFAARYTAAWCSQDAARVATFFSPGGSLAINGGPAAVGRAAITASAQGFMTAFPDLEVTMDDLVAQGDRILYRWTLAGTNTGPGGSGQRVRISGVESWRIGSDGLVAESLGSFDVADYQRQLAPSGGGMAERGRSG